MENHKNDLELDYIKIKNYLSNNNGTNTKKISNDLNITTCYLFNLLNIWEKNWNTYFEFGRLFSTNHKDVLNKEWFWIDNTHHLSRKQNLTFSKNTLSESFYTNNLH